ncbi:GNAT family N-acetyltransferase [Agrobacterium larrymoorei]|uniref:GNAT family N-acetyltransferase n=1 Tax=Agrobacterium larrymoorei TaxID=160699 RepID=A0AAF0KD04_9HYPH|nr:GNAT family N-acetyltransferase [Agrobacterium larrymoorei]WHA40378.1 GNAT family N-acetyltransferase [Agrobacterium larrymoorei]
MVIIRAGRQDEFGRLAEIELDAFVVWAKACNVSLEPAVAPVHLLQASFDQGLLLVAEEDGRVLGFALGSVVDGDLYIAEVDVERAAQGKGIGRALMLALLEQGRERGLITALLTTDRYAPFNAPFYAKLGFRILEKAETPAFLLERLEKQVESGLDAERRVAMRLGL